MDGIKKQILGVKIDDFSMDEAVQKVEGFLKDGKKHYIVTPNPEFLVAAQKDERFRELLNNADLSIPDGIGLKLSGKVKNRISGTDLMEKLIALSAEKGYTIGFLGGKEGVAEKALERSKQQYQNISVTFVGSGGIVDGDGNLLGVLPARFPAVHPHSTTLAAATRQDPSSLSPLVNKIPPTDILFVAFGHVKQEKWIVRNLPKLPVKVMMGVGGAFDYFSGKVPRAPFWMRSIGLEWLFRLILQPWRIKRQSALMQYLWLLFPKRSS